VRLYTLRVIRPLAKDEAAVCARMMVSSEPWLTFGLTFDEAMTRLLDAQREVYVSADPAPLGFIILNVRMGPFSGYIQTICVAAEARDRGIGSELMAFAEERLFRAGPNVFLCVSSFNPRARALYERLGYKAVGEFEEFLIRGQSEILMRKTRGPLRER
jgi:ribosomal-protein-alanine N-acetyltransferase